MKNNLLFALTLLCFFEITPSRAQTANTPSTEIQSYVYAQILGITNAPGRKIGLRVDFGQEQGFFDDLRLRNDSTGKMMEFNSMIDGINYLASRGWEIYYVQILPEKESYDIQYLLRKKRQ